MKTNIYTGVVYHLPIKSGNFGWNVNGKIDFVSPNGNFLEKTGFVERETKIPKRNFRMENVRSICQFLQVLGLLAWIAFDPTFQEKVVVMERAHPRGNFYSGFDASHLLQLSTNRFLRVTFQMYARKLTVSLSFVPHNGSTNHH